MSSAKLLQRFRLPLLTRIGYGEIVSGCGNVWMILHQGLECLDGVVDTPLRHVQPPKMVAGLGQRRLQLQGAAQMDYGAIVYALFGEGQSKSLLRFSKFRVQAYGFLYLADALWQLPVLQQNLREPPAFKPGEG